MQRGFGRFADLGVEGGFAILVLRIVILLVAGSTLQTAIVVCLVRDIRVRHAAYVVIGSTFKAFLIEMPVDKGTTMFGVKATVAWDICIMATLVSGSPLVEVR